MMVVDDIHYRQLRKAMAELNGAVLHDERCDVFVVLGACNCGLSAAVEGARVAWIETEKHVTRYTPGF